MNHPVSVPQECPICMDIIDMAKNCSTTECGHCFHTSCLARNIQVNGINCPFCRSIMTKQDKDKENVLENATYDSINDEFVTVRIAFRNRNGRRHMEPIIVDVETEYIVNRID